MESWRVFIVALALSCASVLGADTPPTVTTMPSDLVTTTLVPESTPTHTATSEITTTPTTTKPHSTTTKPPSNNTTPSTTTQSPPTQPPTTTTTPPPPTTTPAPPSPTPISDPGVWNCTDLSTNITCIVVQFTVKFNVSYAAGKDSLNQTFKLPTDSVQTGCSCGNTSQFITLSWPKEQPLAARNNFSLHYQLNSTAHQYYVQEVSVALFYNATLFPNATYPKNMEFHYKGKEWATGVSYSYRCQRPQSLKLSLKGDGAGSSSVAEITLSDVQEEAFRSVKGHQFSIAMDCEPVDVPDVVPIAVGCALGALVLVVLAAYLVGRRRSQARGYLSM